MEKPRSGKVYASVLDVIGNTPMIRLNKIPKEDGVECEVLVKCEFMNPTGSHKDRMALAVIEAAEKAGNLKPGGIIVEATSGNAGLSLAFVAAVKGYKAILAAISKTSFEKTDLMQGFGADVIRGKPGAHSRGPGSVFDLAEKIVEKVPGSLYTTQFTNKANPNAHYMGTGQEILEQCGGKIDYFFMSAGTGGTITGVGRRLKEVVPKVRIIGCDPVGSLIGSPQGVYAPYKVEGVGYDFVPENCDMKVMDEWAKFDDKHAFEYAGRLMREEGLMCGGSCGGILWCALEYAKKHKLTKDQTLVVVLPDTSRNYLTKHVNKEWMFENGFFTEEQYRKLSMESSFGHEKRFGDDLQLKDLECPALSIIKANETIENIWKQLQQEGILVANKTGTPLDEDYKGLVTCKDVLAAVSTGKLTAKDSVENVLKTDFCVYSENLKVSTAGKIMENRDYILFRRESTKKVCMMTPVHIMGKMKL